MRADDIDSIVAVITDHDEDDGESAAQSLASSDLSNLFVLEWHGRAAGISGCAPIPGSDGAYWLSWTYLDKGLRGQGHGRRLVDRALDEMRYRNARKVFIKVSDYRDDESGDLYAAARKCYASAGFREELFIRDYYDEGESLTVFSLEPRGKRSPSAAPIENESPALEIERWFEIAETDDAWSLAWRVKPGRSSLGAALARPADSAFNAANLERELVRIKADGARAAFLSFPSNLTSVREPLAAAGFEAIGQLTDFHGAGLHELHFGRYLD